MEMPIAPEPSLRDLFPEFSEAQCQEIKEFLDGYCAIVLEISERLERENGWAFDESLRAS